MHMEKILDFNIDFRKIGIVIVGISVILFLIVLLMTQTIMALRLELHKTCPLPPEACPYKSSVPIESVAGFILSIAIGIFGIFLIFVKPAEVTSPQKTKIKQIMKSLTGDEKKVYNLIVEADGSIFQTDLIQKTGYSKVRISRILDRLETKGIIERRRRGMTNLVLSKY